MGLFSKIKGGVIKQLGGVAIEGLQSVNGDRVQQDQQASDLRTAGLEQFSQEFQHATDGWFDSFMNGVNRTPRPFGFYAVIGFMVWVGLDPDAALLFAANMVALPVWFQVMISGVIGFFYGMRPIEKHFSRRFRKADLKALDSARARQGDIGANAGQPDADEPMTAAQEAQAAIAADFAEQARKDR